jgi:ribosomal protein S18 acetylase RimI-like enzyme
MRQQLRLEPMSNDEFAALRAQLVEGYAQDIAASRSLDIEHARKTAEEQTDNLLPQGTSTPDMLLFAGKVADTDEPVGWIWLALPQALERPDTAWVYNVQIDVEHRGKGYGRALMLAAEEELVRQGVSRLGLNVFGYNKPAVRLYESLGFEITAQQMAKPLRTA